MERFKKGEAFQDAVVEKTAKDDIRFAGKDKVQDCFAMGFYRCSF